jgi:hypothetical protein
VPKENLIIIPGFGTNSRLFEELKGYLSGFFNVHFIDLPGFRKEIPPLSKITMDNYAQFVVERIKESRLKHYLIAGLSLGFGIISRIEFDNKCKGILGIGPYLGSESINPRVKAKMSLKILFLDLICFFRLYRLAWRTVLFHRYLKKVCLSRKLPDFTLKEMDSRTYFETARLLFRFHLKKPSFDHLPYVLIMNKKDDSVSYDYLAQQMKDNIEKLLVVNTQMAHNPAVLTEKYFAANLPKSKILRLLKFITDSQPLSPWSRLVNWFKRQFWPQKAVKS